MHTVETLAHMAKTAARSLALLTGSERSHALNAMAEELLNDLAIILEANALDMEAARSSIKPQMLDRLMLDEQRLESIASAMRKVASLDDPIGEITGMVKRPNGLVIGQMRVPLGVIAAIYEARPNVSADISALCIKTGNACILRGGKEAINSNKAIVNAMRRGLQGTNVPQDSLLLIEDTTRDSAHELMHLNGLIDALIPRGGAGLINNVTKNASVPVIQTGAGVCHTYIDERCDSDMAISVAVNAKVSRPSVCNSMETLLVHTTQKGLLSDVLNELKRHSVEIHGCARVKALAPWVEDAKDSDWETEYNDLILSVKLVDSLDEAIEHIERYGTHHSDAIITSDYANAQRFISEVDSSAVYVNASTRFSDGEEFGLGAEVGISTQKLHARGPMGLNALTSLKYVVYGSGQIR